ncbi:MAG TPA: hypothetical protein VFQ92_11720 [Blastocatellia bacterium]|nr:hypothetical protein [Blastocatellia bacterium]
MMMILALVLLQQPTQQPQMTWGGWIFMALAWLLILALVSFTFSKVLGNRR